MTSEAKVLEPSEAPTAEPAKALERLQREAMALPEVYRELLAHALLASLDEEGFDPNEVALAWEKEIERRVRAIDSGEMKTVSWAELQAQLRDIVNKPRGT